jgi:HNH endonuclease/NUMOD4 motif/Helix-turn-helix domain of resolvase
MVPKWKPVLGFEDLYAISNDGQIARVLTHGRNPKAIWRILKTDTKPNGYVYVDLSIGNRRERHYVHQLVWEAFKGPIPSGMEPNHKNGIKHDNRLRNFKLVTRSENMIHSFQFLSPSLNRSKGATHHKAKLSENDVAAILAMCRAGISRATIAKTFGISKTAIYLIMKGKNWKHFTGRQP